MSGDQSLTVEECLASFDRALDLIEEAERHGDFGAVTRAMEKTRTESYGLSRCLEHLQPDSDQWARIDERMERWHRWLNKYA